MFKKSLLAIALFSALPLSATTSYYIGASTEGSFGNALIAGGLTASSIINFSGATGAGTNTVTPSGGTGVTFVGSGLLSITASNQLKEDYSGSGSRLDINPGTSIYAIGLHVRPNTITTNLCIEAPGSNSCDNLLNVASGTTEFIGIISTTPVAAFTLRTFGPGGSMLVNDFTVGTLAGTTSGVPEPSTLALLGSALVALPVWARRKKRV